jgi:hypothetical protein
VAQAAAPAAQLLVFHTLGALRLPARVFGYFFAEGSFLSGRDWITQGRR